MMSLPDKIKRYGVVWLLCLLVYTLYFGFFVNRAHVTVTLDVAHKTDFKIYWAKEGQGFSEKNMARIHATPNRKNYTFFLTDLDDVARLRVDPHQYVGVSTLEQLTIRQEGFQKIGLQGGGFARLKPLAQVVQHAITDRGLLVQSSGNDPNFLLEVHTNRTPINYFGRLVRLLALVLLVHLVYFGTRHLCRDHLYVVYLLTGVLLLVATMAFISKQNVHPDEFVHVGAAKYYQDHWLPPQVDAAEIAGTYSPYGVSRLNTDEIYYLFAGKFAWLVDTLQLDSFYATRLFNVFLLFLILLYTLRNVDARLVAVPLLLSPQIWYTFSYCNSDGFALFVAFLVGCQVIDRKSMLHRYFEGEKRLQWYAKGIALAFLFGLLFLIKKNFYPYVAFVFLVIFIDFWRSYYPEDLKLLCVRLLVVCLLGLSLFGAKKGADYLANGAHRTEKIQAMRMEKADHLFHPDTPLEKKHPFLYMKQRGVTLDQLIDRERWFEKTFRSAFGVYGYFTISAPYTYYDIVRWTGLGLLGFFLFSVALRGGWYGGALAGTVVTLSLALIAASLHHSWTGDFQAQGRYLFPIASMLAVLYALTHHSVNRTVFSIGVVAMFLISGYSFISVALHNIPRLVLL